MIASREGNSQLGDIFGLYSDETKAIRHVDFDLFDRSIPRVGMYNLGHDTLEYSSELHRFSGSKFKCLVVETTEATIHCGTGTSIELWDHPEGRHSEMFEMLYSTVR